MYALFNILSQVIDCFIINLTEKTALVPAEKQGFEAFEPCNGVEAAARKIGFRDLAVLDHETPITFVVGIAGKQLRVRGLKNGSALSGIRLVSPCQCFAESSLGFLLLIRCLLPRLILSSFSACQ